MRKGFIFSQNRCVGCNACSAACILENGWTIKPRNVYQFNRILSPSVQIVNISLACSHCDNPVCLSGCPSRAYYREPESQAIVIRSENCLGCNYCKWNCPYDAPKSEPLSLLIEKCNLCYKLVNEGLKPACASACPTGALDFGPISDIPDNNWMTMFPDKKLNPSIEFSGKKESSPLKIVPEQLFDNDEPAQGIIEKGMIGEWSLVAFSSLITLSSAIMVAGLIKGVFPEIGIILPLIISAGIFSLFHLRKKINAWRAVLNILSSPLSREIALYIMYTLLTATALITGNTILLIIASVTGIILLIAIDSVYTYADNRNNVRFHSGQSFLTGLLIASFLAGQIFPFVLVALIKLISGISNIKRSSPLAGLRFMRLALLVTSGICITTGISYPDRVITFLFLAGELLDRILFYSDFDPLNIKSISSTLYNSSHYEEERSK